MLPGDMLCAAEAAPDKFANVRVSESGRIIRGRGNMVCDIHAARRGGGGGSGLPAPVPVPKPTCHALCQSQRYKSPPRRDGRGYHGNRSRDEQMRAPGFDLRSTLR
jgi:hypothetical protein